MLRIILVIDGNEIPLAGRVAEMIRWLAVNEERIRNSEQGAVTLNWSGRSLKPEFREVGNAIHVGDSVSSEK